ncbi:Uncharacterised protein [Burkholderia pseudomallei]|nr:Uncharacterised protein [Burkholderia pseudomallei]
MPLDGGRTCGDRRHDRSPRSGRDGRRRCRRPRMRRHRPTDMNATVRHRQFKRRGKPHGTDSSARHPTALLAALLAALRAALRAVIARGHDHGRYAPFRGDSHQTLERVDRRGPRVRRKRRRGAVRAAGCRRNAARLTGRAALEIPCRRNRNASGAMGRHRPAVRLPCRAKRDSGPTRRQRRIPACSYFDDGQPHGGCLPRARSRRPSPRLRKRVTRH